MILPLAAALILLSCQKSIQFIPDPPADHHLELHFSAVVDAQPLVLGNNFINPFGESYSIRNFKFYLCQVALGNSDSGITRKLNDGAYFLVNFADSSTIRIPLDARSGKYNSISFLLGVDSTRNVSGAQTGALDPANGMFWTWNTGYIMAKLEGNSPVSNQPNQVFEYHIGGFAGSDKVLQKITLTFPDEVLESGKSTEINLSVNANAWFHNPNNITIAATPVITTPGPLARQMSENYSGMFKIISVVSQ